MKSTILVIGAYAIGLAGAGWAVKQPVTAPVVADAALTESGAKPLKPARSLRVSYLPCPTGAGACRLVLSWIRPQTYVSSTDTAVVTWYQVTPSASRLDSLRTRGTADTIDITRPPSGTAKAGTVKLCYARAGYNGFACNSLMAWTVEAEAIPPPVASAVTTRRAGGDTLWVLYTVAASAPDTLRARITATTFTKTPIDRKYVNASQMKDSMRVLLNQYTAPVDRRFAGEVIPSANFGTQLLTGQTMAWSWVEPVAPPDTATGLKLTGIYIKPDTVKITMAEWNKVGVYGMKGDTLYGQTGQKLSWKCPSGGAGKCPQQQFCAFSKMSDNKVYMTDNSSAITYCQGIFQTFPNRAPNYQPAMANETERILVHVNGGDDGTVAVDYVKYGAQRLIRVSTGEWIRADFLPLAFAQ